MSDFIYKYKLKWSEILTQRMKQIYSDAFHEILLYNQRNVYICV